MTPPTGTAPAHPPRAPKQPSDAWGQPTPATQLPAVGERLVLWVLAPALICLLCLLGLYGNYTFFHLLAELASVILGLVTLAVATAAWRFTKNYFLIFVGISLGWTGLIDLVHAMAYPGMGMIPGEQATWSTQLWLGARSLQAAMLIAAPWFVAQPFRVGALHVLLGAYTALVLVLVLGNFLPITYIPGVGQTDLKIAWEYGIMAGLGLAMAQLWKQRSRLDSEQWWTTMAALALMVASELAFTHYLSVYGPANAIGHLLKVWAYWLVFVGLARATLTRPFGALAAAAATYDAVPDPTVIVAKDGRILRANPAAGALVGTEPQALEGQSAHGWFHEPHTQASECRICSLVANADWQTTAQLQRGTQILAWRAAPYTRNPSLQAHVEAFHDITRQQEQEAEARFQSDRTAALLKLTEVAHGLPESAFLQYGQELAEQLTGSQIAFVHMVNDDQETIELVAWSRRTLEHYCRASYDKHYPISKAGIWADAFRRRGAVVINNYATAEGKRGLPEGHSSLVRLISVPVIEGDKVRLMTGVGNKAAEYTDRDVETVRLISDAMWSILQRRRVVAALEVREREVSALLTAIPDPLWLKGPEGEYRAVNPAFARAVGRDIGDMIGRTDSDLFPVGVAHAFSTTDKQVLRSGKALTEEQHVTLPGQTLISQTTKVPVRDGTDAVVGIVGIARDVTEARRLAKEREELLASVQERVKELKCLAAVTALTEQPGATPDQLFAGVVNLLPAAFRFPEQLRASATGQYGTFGETAILPCRLDRPLRMGGRVVGTLTVAYADRSESDLDAFLPEEVTLVDMVGSRLCLALERLDNLARLHLQTRLYDTLTAANRAIVHATREDQLLGDLFEAMVGKAGLPTVALVQLPQGSEPGRVVLQRGVHGDPQVLLAEWLAPGGWIGQHLWQLQAGGVVTLPAEQSTAPHALVPLRKKGALYFVAVLAAQPGESLGLGHLRLLDEIASDMSYALTALATEEERQQATALQRAAEAQLAKVFSATPVPMLLIDRPTGKITALNSALVNWLGYQASELPDLTAWFAAVYPDPGVQQSLAVSWDEAVAQTTAEHVAVHSPELTLRRKDGAEVRAVGTTVSLGDQSVVVWQDLTDIRNGEAALRESEQRFRGMIEHAVTGIYVRQSEVLVYVNDALCQVMGYAREQLLGQPVERFVRMDPAIEAQMRAARDMSSDQPFPREGIVPIVHALGEVRYLAVRIGPIEWEGQPATIGMVEDVTERERARAEIAKYVEQLERSMRGTLEVVARMVDERDPYTAGHERRVGLLAKAIGHQLGWEAARCEALELMGMVHDVGKIGMPAEILTKPGRLTPVEYALVQQHASIGHDILGQIDFPMPIAEIVWQHHERMDGSGYPRGLKGDEILPEARVLAVADVLESMASHRPYRPALGLDAALAELEAGSGSRYDAVVVAAVQRMVSQEGYVLPA